MEDYTAEMIRDMAFSFCPQCGTAIVPNHKGRPRKFCSPECRSRWNNTHPKPENWKTVRSKICVCGREFCLTGISTGWNENIAAGLVLTGAEERRQKMQPLSIERDVRRNGIRMDCVFEGTAFDAAREQVRTLRLSGTKLSQIAEQTGMPVEQVMDYCRELGLPEIGSCHLVPPGRVKERRCPVCGRIIGQSGRGAPRKYCSDECYAEYERRNYKRGKGWQGSILSELWPSVYGNLRKQESADVLQQKLLF